ncbi:hypothetical protein [Candidatus Thiosymbion oneisti]|uniref:hypothetical protein n=1 Tax=Candidatus Thiosymbion oneisti TaxID=589554 RepID=UPI001FB72727|nr:hypothetical protein [Candidatus Thiosymbion oneisti]
MEQAGEERLVVVQEVQRAWLRKLNTREVFEAIHRVILERYEILVHAILLLKPGRLPKTSSGKVQRRACRGQFMAGILESVGKSKSKPSKTGYSTGSVSSPIFRRIESIPGIASFIMVSIR